MTALKSTSKDNFDGIRHPCLVRKSSRTYELVDPKKPGEITSFDVGQVKAIVEMDKRLRGDDEVKSIPAGYSSFAQVFNKYTSGQERFATFSYKAGKPVISKPGRPIVWDQFLIDDSIVGRNYDLILGASGPPSSPPSSQLLSSRGSAATSASDPTSPSKEMPQLKTLSAYMRNSMSTTDELVKFWVKRGAIEFDYASRLARLAECTIGQQGPSEFRDAIDAFRVEAARQAMNHNTLATQIAVELESRCLKLQLAQSTHWLKVCEPSIKRLEEPVPVQEHVSRPGVSSEWKKEYKDLRYSLDIRRLRALRGSRSPFQLKGETGYYDQTLASSPLSRKAEWSALRKSCRQMEEERSQSMEELLSAFGDVLGAIHDSHTESRTTIQRSLDLFKPQEVVEHFSSTFVDEDDIILDTDRPQQIRDQVGRSRNALSHRSLPKLQITPLLPEGKKSFRLEAERADNGAHPQISQKDHHANENSIEKALVSDSHISHSSRRKRLSGPRPLLSFVYRPLSRSISSSSHTHPVCHVDQQNIHPFLSSQKHKPTDQPQIKPHHNLIDL